MTVAVASSPISAAYKGSTAIDAIYQGANLVWPSGFDPLSIAWHTVAWAEDPAWTNPGDGNAVASWRNSGAGDFGHFVQATGAQQPIYRSSVTGLNNKPAIEFNGSSHRIATVAGTNITGVTEHVLVLKLGSTAPAANAIQATTNTSKRRNLQAETSARWRIFQGAGNIGGGTPNTSAHFLRAVFDATDTIDIDGTNVASGAAGSENIEDVRLGSNSAGTAFMNGHIAFFGMKSGTLTAQERTDLLGWAQSHYSTP